MASYRVADLVLRSISEHIEFTLQTDELLSLFRDDSNGSTGWSIDFRYGRSTCESLPGDAQLLWSGHVPPGIPATNYASRGFRRLALTDIGHLDLDLVQERATIVIESAAQIKASRYFLISLLCIALASRQHVPLHAACLALRSERGVRSVIIVAPSGTGKSTSSLALTSAGWKLMGDDLTLLSRQSDRICSWGFPRACHIRKPTLALLPWLNELPLRPAGLEATFELSVEDLGERSFGRPQLLEPALLLILDRPNTSRHHCIQMDPVSAMAHVCHENVQPVDGVHDTDAAESFAMIADLVRQTPAFRLSAGPQLHSLADYLADVTGVAA